MAINWRKGQRKGFSLVIMCSFTCKTDGDENRDRRNVMVPSLAAASKMGRY